MRTGTVACRRWRLFISMNDLVPGTLSGAPQREMAQRFRYEAAPSPHAASSRSQTRAGSCFARHTTSPDAIKLRRAQWLRMHPVERWTVLVDLGRRGAYLIEKPVEVPASCSVPHEMSSTSGGLNSSGSTRVLGGDDAQVRFSAASSEAHRQLCAALPYAARLHLSLSLLLWVRCLRDVQDTLARLRLPFAMVRRPQRYAVADVFPTRLSEYWVDVHSTVAVKMNATLNSTAEQIPAPYAWNPETSEPIEDTGCEAKLSLSTGRALHGCRHRLTGKALLQEVQNVKPRSSAEDEFYAGKVRKATLRGRRHRRRCLMYNGSMAPSFCDFTEPQKGVDGATPPLQHRSTSVEFSGDAERRVPPVSLEAEPLEDAAYHGNATRGEGCPLSDEGESSPAPIFIRVPPTVGPTRCNGRETAASVACASSSVEADRLLRYCVLAHAALLSSLFIEGRVVDFRTNHPVVFAYVQWLMEELTLSQYVCVSPVTEEEATASVYRPYYPSWCWRNVLVLIPPRPTAPQSLVDGFRWRGITEDYSTALLKDWAARVVASAPCAVLVEGGADVSYVKKLKEEVQSLREGAMHAASAAVVEWVAIVAPAATAAVGLHSSPSSSSFSCAASGDEGGPLPPGVDTPRFRPQQNEEGPASSTWLSKIVFSLLQWLNKHLHRSSTGLTKRAAAPAAQQRSTAFLDTVCETLRDRFYTCELLYSPTQSCLTPYRFERWIWEQLPDNVRVVGVNTAPLDVLYYFPQGTFLGCKVGNAFRYRAVERTVVSKGLVPAFCTHPLRYAATQWRLQRRRWWSHTESDAGGLHAELSVADRDRLASAVFTADSQSSPLIPGDSRIPRRFRCRIVHPDKETASQVLLKERMVEYLANPSKWTLLGLAMARFLRM